MGIAIDLGTSGLERYSCRQELLYYYYRESMDPYPENRMPNLKWAMGFRDLLLPVWALAAWNGHCHAHCVPISRFLCLSR